MENTDQQPWVKNYQPGVPAEIELPTESLVAMLERSVAEAGSAPALEFFGRRTSYTELGEQVDRAAAGLRRLGVRAGDRVALILPNCPQHVVAFYAVLRLGAVVVEHNPLYTSRELRHQFEDHQARVVITWDKAAAETRDREVQKTLLAGTNVQFANGKAARTNLLATDVVSTQEIRKVVANLRNAGAIAQGDDELLGVFDPSVEMDISADATWVAAQQYSNIKALYNGEAGAWMGVRWTRSNFLLTMTGVALVASSTTTVGGAIAATTQIFNLVTSVDNNTGFETIISQQTSSTTGAGATNKLTITMPATAGYTYNVYAGTVSGTLFLSSSGNAPSAVVDILTVPVAGQLAPAPPATGVVVHITWVFGQEAFSVVELDGMSLQTYTTPKGSTDSDPLQQRRKVGWKMAFKSVICNNSYFRRVESGSAF